MSLGLLGLGLGLSLVEAACERPGVDGDPRRASGGAATTPLPATAAAADSTAEPVAGRGVVAWLDGEPIPIAEARSLLGGGAGHDPARRRMAVEGAIARRLAAREERSRRARLEQAPAPHEDPGSSSADAFFERLRDEVTLSEDELQAHYEKTRSRYLERQVRLRRQVFATGATDPTGAVAASSGAAAGAAAKDSADVAIGAPPPAASSPTSRLDPILSDVLGPVPLRDLPRSLLPEVLALEAVGQRIVIEREAEAAFVELVEILPAEPLPFERVRDRVEASLRTLRSQEAMHVRLAELRARSSVAIEETTLAEDVLWEAAEPLSPSWTSSSLSSSSASSPSSS